MRLPLSLNQSGWPRLIGRRRLGAPDPRALASPDAIATMEAFARHVSVFEVGRTFKTTRPGRHRGSNTLIARLLAGTSPVILDIGVSDGSTSLDLMAAIGHRFDSYYVTDRALAVRLRQDRRGRAWFYDEAGRCMLLATPRWVVYPEAWPRWLRGPLAHGIPPYDVALPEVSLVQPGVVALARRDRRVVVQNYDVFQPWPGPRPMLVKIANLINRDYFTDEEIVRALRNIRDALEIRGWLLIVENCGFEQASLFERTSEGFRGVAALNGGVAIADLVQRTA